MTDTRFMPCSVCGGDGGFETEPRGAYLATEWFECPACLGAKVVEVELEPIEEEDTHA